MPDADPAVPPPRLPSELRAAFARRADPDGFLPFDRFMDVALYAPGVGFYARGRSPFGPAGDFYTAPRVHPLFARTIASRIAEVRDDLGAPTAFRVVDLGSGDGTLLAGIVRALGERKASEGVEAVVVDRADPRRAASFGAVTEAARDAGAVARTVTSFAELGPSVGCVLAHELLDAQPARRLRWDGTAWREVGFRLDGDRLLPVEAPARSAASPSAGPDPGAADAGVVVEVAPAAEAIVREVADHLVRGWFGIVDFGADERELRAASPRGTVTAVRAHRTVPLGETVPGDADLSVFVNFTRVRAAAAAAGLVEVAYRSQAEALGAWGFAETLSQALQACRSPEEEVRLRLAAKNLLFGFGTFRVLELVAPGATASPQRLSGASPPERP